MLIGFGSPVGSIIKEICIKMHIHTNIVLLKYLHWPVIACFCLVCLEHMNILQKSLRF